MIIVCNSKFSTFFCTIFTANSGREIVLPAAVLRLSVNYIVIYDFCGSAMNIVHTTNPFKLIFCNIPYRLSLPLIFKTFVTAPHHSCMVFWVLN